jgi:hypothetical protein
MVIALTVSFWGSDSRLLLLNSRLVSQFNQKKKGKKIWNWFMSLSLSGEEDEDQWADMKTTGARAQQWNVTRFFSLSTPDWTVQRTVDKLTNGYCASGFVDDCRKPTLPACWIWPWTTSRMFRSMSTHIQKNHSFLLSDLGYFSPSQRNYNCTYMTQFYIAEIAPNCQWYCWS